MLSLRATVIVLLWSGVLLATANPASGQCEIHEDAKLTASDAAQQTDLFGRSVSVDGTIAIVGAELDACPAGIYCGSAYVYRFNGNNWVEEAKLTASDAAQGDQFGVSLSISGNVAVVGAISDDCGSGTLCGSAYAYRFNGSTWVEEQKLSASDAANDDRFGVSVSVSGNVTIVGAIGDACAAGSQCGSAYVYRFNGSIWVEEAKLTASDAHQDEYFGISVSVSGDLAVVGAFLDDCSTGFKCGSAYVYRYNGSSWIEEAKLTASDAAAYDNFGSSVSVSGGTAVVGSWNDDCVAGRYCGSAYVYRFNGSNWVQQAKLTASDAAQDDYFGYSVSISGESAVVGAYLKDCAAGQSCGSAYVYRFDGSIWIEEGKLAASDAAANDVFGVSVSVSGNVAIVGAYADDCTASRFDCGSVYVYALTDCNANGIPDECEIAACAGDPACADCNANSIPDGCETDCNSNAIPDECDVRAGVSRDTDANGIPDECEAGACCDHDPFGGCTDGLTQAECNCGRCEWSKLVLCDDVQCSRGSIPAVGAWGLAILTLLLLTGAKIRFGRGTRATAP